LTHFGLTVILDQIEENLISLLDKHNMDWGQKSKLLILIAFSKENSFDLSEKAIAIYEHIQSVKHFLFKF
jgi:hypothetical protein